MPQALARGDFRGACEQAAKMRDIFGWGNFWIELQRHLLPEDGPRIRALSAVAGALELGLVATGGVHYAIPEHRELADVLACIRLKTTLDEAGTRLRPNGEYYLRSPEMMAKLFAEHPRAVAASAALAERCTFRLDRLRNEFPDFPLPPGETAFSYLYSLVHEGVRRRYRPVTPEVSKQIAHELGVIERLDLAGYFLIVWDIVRFAMEREILIQGRGSAANSAVCYALNITSVDPVGLKMLFERFLSEERAELPDIDLDCPSGDQREQIIQYVYQRYGREHSGMVAEVISYRARSAVRDIGKALGLSLDQVDALAKSLDSYSSVRVGEEAALAAQAAFDMPRHEAMQVTTHGEPLPMSAADVESAIASLPAALAIESGSDTAQRLYDLCRRIDSFPRHLSQHVGGMVITRSPLIEVAPLEKAAMPDRTILCWDKDDCATLGLDQDRSARPWNARRHRAGDQGDQARARRDGRSRRLARLRRPGGLRHAVRGGHGGPVPSRVARADGDAAAPEAAQFLRHRRRGGDHPARAHPRRYGPSVHPPAQRARTRHLSASRSSCRCSNARWACRSSKSKACASPWRPRVSRPAKRTNCGARWATSARTRRWSASKAGSSRA